MHFRSQRNNPLCAFRYPPLPFPTTTTAAAPPTELVRAAAIELARKELASVAGWFEFLALLASPSIVGNDNFRVQLFEWLVEKGHMPLRQALQLMNRER